MLAQEFDTLYLESYSALCQQVYALCGDRAHADVCVQKAFAQAWAHRDKFGPDESPREWVYAAAQRMAASHRSPQHLEGADAVFTPPAPSLIRARGDKLRRRPRTLTLVAGALVVAVAAGTVGATVLLRPAQSKENAVDPGNSVVTATPTPSTSATMPVPTRTPATTPTSATTSALTLKALSGTACLVQPQSKWAKALTPSTRFAWPDFDYPHVLTDKSLVIAKALNKDQAEADVYNFSIQRYATLQATSSTELLRTTKGLVWLMVDDTWMVWADSNQKVGISGLNAKPLGGGPTIRLTDEQFAFEPHLSNGKVRWVTRDFAKIREFDLATKKLSDAVTLPPGVGSVRLYDDHYTASAGGSSLLYRMDGVTVATLPDTVTMTPIPGTGESKWYRLLDKKLVRWSPQVGDEPISLSPANRQN